MQINPSIFKAYDIRGIYPTDLNEEIAYPIGRAFAAFLGVDKVVVGRDMRLSGPQLFEAVTRGLTDQGADVIDIGRVSTDQFYFACATLGLPGMMVTASHNPKAYNGFKMVKKMPYLLSGDAGIQDLRKLVESEAFPKATRMGQIVRHDFKDEFVQKVLSLIDVNALVGAIHESPVRESPVRELPVRELPVRESPVRESPVRESPLRESPLRVVVDTGKRWSIKAGYRFLEGGADNDEVYTFALVHYVAAGLIVRF